MRITGELQRSAVCSSFSPGMASSRQDYIAPWWTYWLHNFPHLNFNFQTVDNTFKPEDASYQQVRGEDVSLVCGIFIALKLLGKRLTFMQESTISLRLKVFRARVFYFIEITEAVMAQESAVHIEHTLT